MGLLSIFKRGPTPASNVDSRVDPGDAVQQARSRARQRLIGAVVLVGLGVIGFPLVFETQPRPIPVDIPIELPRKENAAPLAMPPAKLPSAQAQVPTPPSSPSTALSDAPATAPSDVVTESREEAGREVVVPSAAASRADARPVAAASAPVVAKSSAAASADDGARAQALLDGKQGKPASDGRFVVQVGAFADAGAARDTRAKVEKLGLKTYTQVVNTPAGSRIRVRAGPFASRDEADKALAKARGAGLAGAVLTL